MIAALGPAGTLINVARGSVVDEAALIVSPELMALPNVIVQPHHGAATGEAREAIGRLVIDNIVAKLAGQSPPTPVI